MTQQPETPDPIQSAGQIDDPDQPTTVAGQDDSRAGRDTQPDDAAADGDPEQSRAAHRTAASTTAPGAAHGTRGTAGDGATAASATTGAAREGRADDGGTPPKAVQETGVPVVPEGAVDAQGAREVDSQALAGTRKFQPPAGADNPNVSANRADRDDVSAAGTGDDSAGYERAEDMPVVEPVRHSVPVEERVEEQERDYDLHTTEDGERYLTPTDENPAV
ncbi:hypothetical protein [Kocuria rhizophila]|uniref:hypothetical protein n=1 Tax=Kocuria rhizophila TaxID=72000 RepID=UPI001EF6BC0A|nr:hypothetical protein [Kocuria rhizophila]MCG7424048.1 hypothetical protein [Kocuria rhizophila]